MWVSPHYFLDSFTGLNSLSFIDWTEMKIMRLNKTYWHKRTCTMHIFHLIAELIPSMQSLAEIIKSIGHGIFSPICSSINVWDKLVLHFGWDSTLTQLLQGLSVILNMNVIVLSFSRQGLGCIKMNVLN